MTSIKKVKFTSNEGSRNLFLLGLISIIVAVSTTGVSLAIYHNSGDIYLDRSRPGYLPDEEEIQNEDTTEVEYNFGEVEKIDAAAIEKYLTEINKESKDIESYMDSFSDGALSDENLIQKPKNTE